MSAIVEAHKGLGSEKWIYWSRHAKWRGVDGPGHLPQVELDDSHQTHRGTSTVTVFGHPIIEVENMILGSNFQRTTSVMTQWPWQNWRWSSSASMVTSLISRNMSSQSTRLHGTWLLKLIRPSRQPLPGRYETLGKPEIICLSHDSFIEIWLSRVSVLLSGYFGTPEIGTRSQKEVFRVEGFSLALSRGQLIQTNPWQRILLGCLRTRVVNHFSVHAMIHVLGLLISSNFKMKHQWLCVWISVWRSYQVLIKFHHGVHSNFRKPVGLR